MNITSAKYEENGSITAIMNDQQLNGITEESRYWGMIQEWVAAGNSITPYTASDMTQSYLDAIDQAAGRARQRHCSAGWCIEEEYRRAEGEAREFAAVGYPADAIPAAVQAEMIGIITAQQAADTIIAKADALKAALDTIRTARLAGKDAVNNAATDAGKAAASATAVAELDAIQPAITGS